MSEDAWVGVGVLRIVLHKPFAHVDDNLTGMGRVRRVEWVEWEGWGS